MQVDATFEPEPRAVRTARHFIDDHVPGDIGEDAMLIGSELVSHVFAHARTPVTVTVLVEPALVRVEVVDSSAVLPAVTDLVANANQGRGLHLVDALSDAWGVESRHGGKTMWFEIRRRPERSRLTIAHPAAAAEASTRSPAQWTEDVGGDLHGEGFACSEPMLPPATELGDAEILYTDRCRPVVRTPDDRFAR